MLNASDPEVVLPICIAILLVAGFATLYWVNRHKLIRLLAIGLGISLLVMTTSRDRRTAQVVQASLQNYESQVKAAEAIEGSQALQIEKLEMENRELKTLLSKSSEEKKEVAEDAKRLSEAVRDAANTVAEVVPGGSSTTTLRIKDAVLFDVDKSALRCDSREKLSKIIGFLTYQVRLPHTQIQIYGHTDNTGTDAHDDALSNARAAEVRNYFVSSGIPSDALSAKGMGKRQPVGFTEPQSAAVINRENSKPELQQRNRRVEIVVSTQ